jgi:hypothetical protein
MKIGAESAAVESISRWTLTRMKRKPFRVLSIWGGVVIGIGCVVGSWAVESYFSGWTEPQQYGASVFGALNSLLWTLASTCVILPMLLDYGGMFRRFLCHRLWCGLSRLVFGAYLLHPIIILLYNAMRVSPAKMGFLPFVYDASGNIIITLTLAFFFHLVIEQPIIYLTSVPAAAARDNA